VDRSRCVPAPGGRMGEVLLVVWVVPIEATPPQILLWVTAAIAAADRTVTSGDAQPQLHVP